MKYKAFIHFATVLIVFQIIYQKNQIKNSILNGVDQFNKKSNQEFNFKNINDKFYDGFGKDLF